MRYGGTLKTALQEPGAGGKRALATPLDKDPAPIKVQRQGYFEPNPQRWS